MNYFDCHADTLTELPLDADLWKNRYDLDLERVKGFAERYTQIFAIWKDRGQIGKRQPEDIFRQLYQRALQLLNAQKEKVIWCTGTHGMQSAHEAGKAAVFLSVEDVSLMGSLVERVRELGIRFVMLTWNYENEYACGAVSDQSRGLTKKGVDLVNRLLGQDVVLDISHLSDQGVEDIFQLTSRPVMASHSNVREICRHPRNLNQAQIRELIRRKGLMGLNFYGDFVGAQPDVMDLVRHADAVLQMGGEDILAIGSDFDGCGGRFPEGIRGVQSIPYLKEAMRKAGFTEIILEKIFSRNAERFLMENIK